MKWYEKKFTDFFNKWKKGDLFLQDGKGYFGEVEELEIAERFEESAISFLCYQKSGQERKIQLKDIRHFHAFNGPILNISKYLKILKLEESYLSVIDGGKSEGVEEKAGIDTDGLKLKQISVVEAPAEDGEHKIICLAFGLEFYTTEKAAGMLKKNIKKLLFSKLQEIPVLSIDDRAPVDLTPTFSRWHSRFFSRAKLGRGRHVGSSRHLKSVDQDKILTK